MRTNIYIRKDNETKWAAIFNRSEWVNRLLENSDDTSHYGETVVTPVGPAVTLLSEALPIMTPRNKDMEFCKHNAVKGLCKKGCK